MYDGKDSVDSSCDEFLEIPSREHPHSSSGKIRENPQKQGIFASFLPTYGLFLKNLQFQIPSKIPFFRTSKKRT
jgi:hypothetical protein